MGFNFVNLLGYYIPIFYIFEGDKVAASTLLGINGQLSCKNTHKKYSNDKETSNVWEIDFLDNFNTFNSNNWQDQRIWVNNETHCYVPDNEYETREVSNGTLKLKALLYTALSAVLCSAALLRSRPLYCAVLHSTPLHSTPLYAVRTPLSMLYYSVLHSLLLCCVLHSLLLCCAVLRSLLYSTLLCTMPCSIHCCCAVLRSLLLCCKRWEF